MCTVRHKRVWAHTEDSRPFFPTKSAASNGGPNVGIERFGPDLLLCPFSGAVNFSCLAVIRLKSRVLVRFWWNCVSELFLWCIFWKKKIWQILIDFSTIFAIKAIGGSHMVHMREKCAWWVQKSYFCALCVHIQGAYILPIYSPEYGDNPQYPKLKKIPRITGSACSYRGRYTGVFSTILEQIWDSREILKESCRKYSILKKSR